jgi:surface antigen
MELVQDYLAPVRCAWVLLAVATALPALGGCMSGGGGEQSPRSLLSGGDQTKDKDKEKAVKLALPDAVKNMQEKAISKAQGGEVGTLIPWSETKSGLEGTLTWDKTVVMTYSCRRYKQTLSIGNELLNGTLTACPQGDGAWKIVTTPSS